MKLKIISLLSIVLICCISYTNLAFAANDASVQVENENVVESVTFIDSDGVNVTMVKITMPNNTFILETRKNGQCISVSGTADYAVALTFLEKPQVSMPRYRPVYLGTASGVTYIGPEYQTAADLARAISAKIKNTKLSIATQLAAEVFRVHASPVSLWIKKVTDTYEVHGDGSIGFLGYYSMHDYFYVFNHSNTTGSDYMTSSSDIREGTTPGL